MADLGIVVTSFYSTSAGEAMLYLNEQERDHTSVLIDMGYLNTEIIGVEGDAIIYHKVLDVGGGDIAVAWKATRSSTTRCWTSAAAISP